MVTIREVAKAAQVSVATVSRVMNKSGYVNDKTRKHVESVIKALDYQPNDVARSLFKGTSKMIALFVPDITNPFFPELARAIEDITNEAGYTFILCNTDNDVTKEKQYIQSLRQKSIDGIIVVSNSNDNAHFLNANVPILALDRASTKGLPTITVQNYKGAVEAVKYLKRIGCKEIGHIAGPSHVSNAEERKQAYLDEMKHEPWFSESHIKPGYFDQTKAKAATLDLLREHPKVDGLFVANDLMAIGVLQALNEAGYNVPNDISVVGFDGIMLGEMVSPSVTTIAQPIYRLGEIAAKSMIKRIEMKADDVIEVEAFNALPVELIVRNSTRKEVTYE